MKRKRQLSIACIAADLIDGKLGGAEIHAVEVIKRLSKSHKIILFVGPDDSIARVLPKNVKVETITYPRIQNLYGIFYIIWGYFQIERKLREAEFDLLWAKQSYPQAPLAALLKLKFKRPLYITAQNPMLHKEEMVIKGKIATKLGSVFVDLLTPIIAWGLRQADMVAAVSNYSKKLAIGMGVRKIKVIPNGVDNSRFEVRGTKYEAQGKGGGPFRILTTSSLIPRNGIDILIEAVSRLEGVDWRLTIAGEGPEMENIKNQISKLKIEEKVELLGRVNNNQVKRLLANADVFVRSSRKEGFGVSFIEAMAAGVPVIGTSVGGITDFITHNQTGLLVKPEDDRELSKQIERLYKDKKLSLKLIKNAEKLVKEKYDWETISAQVEKEMRKLC